MFDKETTYNYQLGHNTSDGKKIIDLGIEFVRNVQVDIPKNRLMVLRVKEGQNCWV